jgi:hypothetical protein
VLSPRTRSAGAPPPISVPAQRESRAAGVSLDNEGPEPASLRQDPAPANGLSSEGSAPPPEIRIVPDVRLEIVNATLAAPIPGPTVDAFAWMPPATVAAEKATRTPESPGTESRHSGPWPTATVRIEPVARLNVEPSPPLPAAAADSPSRPDSRKAPAVAPMDVSRSEPAPLHVEVTIGRIDIGAILPPSPPPPPAPPLGTPPMTLDDHLRRRRGEPA